MRRKLSDYTIWWILLGVLVEFAFAVRIFLFILVQLL